MCHECVGAGGWGGGGGGEGSFGKCKNGVFGALEAVFAVKMAVDAKMQYIITNDMLANIVSAMVYLLPRYPRNILYVLASNPQSQR
jgi:hypothetical protein